MDKRAGLVIVVLVSACATVSSPKKPDDGFVVRVRRDAAAVSRHLPTSVDETWAEVPGAFRALGYQGGAVTDTAERVFLTPSLLIRGRLYPDAANSAYMDCGRAPAGGAAADEYEVSFVVLVRVLPAPTNGTTLQVAVDGAARRRAENADVVSCTGTGRIEKMFIPRQVRLSARVVQTDTAPERFQAILTLRNTGMDSTRVTFGACSFGLRLYRDSSFDRPPLWDNRPGTNAECILVGYVVTLGPNQQRDRVLSSGVLAIAPAPGRYVAAITWRPSDKAPIQNVAAGRVVIP